MGDDAGPEAAGLAHAPCAAGPVQVLRHHESDALHQHVPAVGEIVGRDGDRLHPPGVLLAVLIHFGEDHSQRHPLAGTDLLQGQIQLENAALGLQEHVRFTTTESWQPRTVRSTGSGHSSGRTTTSHSTVTVGSGKVTWFPSVSV